MPYTNSQLPFDLDVRDPNFALIYNVWAFQTLCDIQELVAGAKREIATSRALMAGVDRLLART